MSSKWLGCYDNGWQGEITPESFSHPAKFSRTLIRRIYEHAFAEGWVAPGMTIVDPFGGVALGALDAMWNGLNWVGIELEPKFVALGEQNIALWQRKYGSKAGWGTARIIQGDSKRLEEVIAGADLVCSSPPFVSSGAEGDGRKRLLTNAWNTDEANSKNPGWRPNCGEGYQKRSHADSYGSSPGQLGAMKEGDFDCVVGSPPFSQAQSGGGINREKVVKQKDGRVHALGNNGYNADMQGNSSGQLASLPEGRFEAVISSPPWEKGAEGHLGAHKFKDPEAFAAYMLEQDAKNPRIHGRSKQALMASYERDRNKSYGNSAGQLGQDSSDTFWSAAREIVAQCHAILKPGGHAIWVVKDFVRKGRRVPFSDQWQALCESVGFRLVCRHRAMLVANHGEQETIFDGTERLTTERKSFFRRLAEKKGSPRIDHEDVLCLERI